MTKPRIDHLEAVRPDSIAQVTIDGTSFYAFNVRPGDTQPWDAANIGPNGRANERAELSLAAAPSGQKGASPYDVRDTTGKQTYDIDYRCKAGLPPHNAAQHEWAMIWQAHPQDDNPSGFRGFTGISIHDGQITLEKPGASGSYFASEPTPIETTIKRRLVVNWSGKADGFVKWIDRATGRLIGRYDGPVIAAGEYKYLKQGYYRAGGLPEGTVYSTLMDISAGDLSETAPAPAPVPVPVPAPVPVQPTAAHLALEAAVVQFDALIAEATAARDKAKAALGATT